jgi:hypothetical protein
LRDRDAAERGEADPGDEHPIGHADPAELLSEDERTEAADRAADETGHDAPLALDRAHNAPDHQAEAADERSGRHDPGDGRERRAAGEPHPYGRAAVARLDFDAVETDAVRRGVAKVDGVSEQGAGCDRIVDHAGRDERQDDFDPHAVRVGGHDRLHDNLGVRVELEWVTRSVALDQVSVDRGHARHLGRRGRREPDERRERPGEGQDDPASTRSRNRIEGS